MDALERAIRTALERGDAQDRTFREKVYRSAFAALERGLAAPGIAPETADLRRSGMKAAIAKVEREFMASPAAMPEPIAPPPVVPSLDLPPERRFETNGPEVAAPVIRIDRDGAPSRPQPGEPSLERLDPREGRHRQEPRMTSAFESADRDRDDATGPVQVFGETRAIQRRRKPLRLLVPLLLFAALAALVWWALFSGSPTAGKTGNGAATTPSTSPDTASDSAGQAPAAGSAGPQTAAEEAGTPVFLPVDLASVSAPAGAETQPGESEEGAFLKIRSGDTGAPIDFAVSAATLQGLAGQRAVFVIDAQAEEGAPTQISVSCDFGALGDCGRRRYEVGIERGEYIFDVDLPDADAGGDGTIAIVSDVENTGRALDLYGIRVSRP